MTNATRAAFQALLLTLVLAHTASADLPESLVKETRTAASQSENTSNEIAPASPSVSVLAGKDGGRAQLSIAFPANKKKPDSGTISIAATTPVSKSDDVTEFFTLEGAAEDIELALAWNRTWFDTKALDSLQFSLAPSALKVCADFNIGTCSDIEIDKEMKDPLRTPAERAALAAALDDAFKVNRNGKEVSLTRAIPIWYFRITAKGGRTERKYFDLAGTENKDDRASHLLQVQFGRVFGRSRITAGLSYQRKFKEQKTAERCTAVENSGTLERCTQLPLGEASTIDSFPLSVEYRFWRKRWAASPQLVYDLDREIFAASLPIYLARTVKGVFEGGIRLDWEEGEDLSASIFVGVPLTLN